MRRVLLACLLAMAVPACLTEAAESVSGLPPMIRYHLAVKSPKDVLAKIDAAVADMTKGTTSAVPPGFVTMATAMQTGLPGPLLDSEKVWHVIVETRQIIFVVQTDLDAMRQGFEIELDEETQAYRTEIPNMGRAWLVEESGKLFVGPDLEPLRAMAKILSGWDASYCYGGDIYFYGELPPNWVEDVPQIRELQAAVDLVRDVRSSDEKAQLYAELDVLNPVVIDGVLELFERWTPQFIHELNSVRRGSVTLDLAANRIGLDLRGEAAPHSYLGKMAKQSSVSAPFNLSAIAPITDGATMITLVGSPHRIIPDYENVMRALNTEIAETVFPAFRERITAITDETLAISIEEYLTTTYMQDGRQYSAVWMQSNEPEKLLDVQKKSMALLNDLLANAIMKPEFRFTLAYSEGKTADNTDYIKTTIAANDSDAFVQAITEAFPYDASVHLVLNQLSEFSQYVAVRNGMVVSVGGAVDEADFAAALKMADRLGGETAVPEEIRKAFESVQTSKDIVVLYDIDGLVTQIAGEAIRMADMEDGGSRFADHLETILESAEMSGQYGASGFGGNDNMYGFSVSIPVASINTIWRNIEKYSATLPPEEDDIVFEDEDYGGDGDEDEIGDDADEEYDDMEEDDAELDEPAGAA